MPILDERFPEEISAIRITPRRMIRIKMTLLRFFRVLLILAASALCSCCSRHVSGPVSAGTEARGGGAGGGSCSVILP